MAKYRVESKLICLSDGVEWAPHAFEFDTELDSRWAVKDRFRSIRAVLMRPIRKRENLPNPDEHPLAMRQFPECTEAKNTYNPDYLCNNPICAAVLTEQLEARKRDADEIERLRRKVRDDEE